MSVSTSKRGLTPKQAAFVREYLKDLNATQAAKRAGYSEKTADTQGPRLLENVGVREAIDAALGKRAARVEVKADDVLRELMRLGMSDIAAVFDVNGRLLKFRDIPEDARRAISSIKVKSYTEPGDEAVEVWTTEIKLWDKPGALGMLGKHLKLFTERVEVAFDGFTDEQLEAKKREIIARAMATPEGA